MDHAGQNKLPGDRDILALLFSIIKLKVYHVFNTYIYSIKMKGIEFAEQSYNFQTLLLITFILAVYWMARGTCQRPYVQAVTEYFTLKES